MKEKDFIAYLLGEGKTSATLSAYVGSVRTYLKAGYKMKMQDLCLWKEREIARVSPATVSIRIHALNKYAEYLGLDIRLKPPAVPIPEYVDDEITMSMYQKLLTCLLEDENLECDAIDGSLLDKEDELTLIKLISDYPSVVAKAAEGFDPSVIAAYLYSVAKTFSHYYHDNQIVKAETRELSKTRLALAKMVLTVLRNGFSLIGIPFLKSM